MLTHGHLNFEFKARTNNLAAAEQRLLALQPLFIGEDHQADTYFHAQKGRLKLREGNIENALIWYNRPDDAGAKQSDVLLYQHAPSPPLKALLTMAHGIDVVVDKKRKIYFIGNVKFHFDEVAGLGTFIEVEAIDKDGSIGLEKLKEQCEAYARLFGIRPEDYIAVSYSNMLKALREQQGQ